MDRILDVLAEYAPKVIGVATFLVVIYIVAGWVKGLVTRSLERARVEKTLAKFLGSMTRWALLVLAVVGCLGVFGVETTSFAAIIGGSFLAIGLAFSGTLGNLAAGVMLLIFRPFKIDDVVNISGETGKIMEISLFSTEMDTLDNRRIIIPNGSVFGNKIDNMTHHPIRRVDVSVGVEYPADIDRTREVLLEGATGVADVLEDPPPAVVLVGLGDSSVDWQVRVWTNTANYWPVRDATIRTAKMSLDKAGIGIPFPQMDVHMETTGN